MKWSTTRKQQKNVGFLKQTRLQAYNVKYRDGRQLHSFLTCSAGVKMALARARQFQHEQTLKENETKRIEKLFQLKIVQPGDAGKN